MSLEPLRSRPSDGPDPFTQPASRRWWAPLLMLSAAATAAVLAASGGTPANAGAATGATVTNCGVRVHVDRPPRRAVTLNQGATETLLTLGLQDRMIGTAYLDDAVLPSLRKAYRSVPVIAKEYPSAERFLAKRPDFAFASYASAFSAKEGVGTRASLAKLGIATMLQSSGCAGAKATRPTTFDDTFAQLRQIGALFGIRARTERVIAAQKAALRRARGASPPGKGVKVLWWDSETKAPFVGACCGGPALIMRTLGATNVFADLKGNWKGADWETVLARKPDVIVLTHASWDTAAAKRAFLAQDKALQSLPAVKRKRFVVIPFADGTPGVRNVEGVRRLAAGLRAIKRRT